MHSNVAYAIKNSFLKKDLQEHFSSVPYENKEFLCKFCNSENMNSCAYFATIIMSNRMIFRGHIIIIHEGKKENILMVVK